MREAAALELAARVARACGRDGPRRRLLGRGSSSVVVRVGGGGPEGGGDGGDGGSDGGGDVVVRIAAPNPGKSARYESDLLIRRLLGESTPLVAEPVATHRDRSVPGVDRAWAVDAYRAGTGPVRGRVPAAVSRGLGAVLAALHRLPVRGRGLIADSREALRGSCADPVAGLSSRFELPRPASGDALLEHPAVRAHPPIGAALLAIGPELEALVHDDRTPAVNHADLHEGQLLTSRGRLVALLDFGDALAAPPEWDLGSYLYFHGPGCLADLLSGYGTVRAARPALLRRAELASVLIALHHGNRAVRLGRPARLEASVAHLRTMLG